MVTDVIDDYEDLYDDLSIDKIGVATGWTRGIVEPCYQNVDPNDQATLCNPDGDTITDTCFNYRFYNGATSYYLECRADDELGTFADGGCSENENYSWFSAWPGVLHDLGSFDACHPSGNAC